MIFDQQIFVCEVIGRLPQCWHGVLLHTVVDCFSCSQTWSTLTTWRCCVSTMGPTLWATGTGILQPLYAKEQRSMLEAAHYYSSKVVQLRTWSLLRHLQETREISPCLPWLSNSNDFRIGTLVSPLPGAWGDRVSDRSCRTSVNTLCLWGGPPRWPSGKVSASRAKDPGFESCLRQDFFGVESYQWLKNWHSSGYPARRLAL